MNARFAAFAPLIALALIVALSAFILLSPKRAEKFEGEPDRAGPAFDLPALVGNGRVNSEALRGRVYVINMFASWCVPCRAEHPEVQALSASGAFVLGVAYKDAPENAQAYLGELGNPYALTALDPQGAFGLELGVSGVPETYVIGKDGRILAAHRGPLTADIVASEIEPALRAGSTVN